MMTAGLFNARQSFEGVYGTGLAVTLNRRWWPVSALFDIFLVGENGQVRWIEAVKDLETARARVEILGNNSPGEYLIVNEDTGTKTVIKVGLQVNATEKTNNTSRAT